LTAFGGDIVDQDQLRRPLSLRFFPVSNFNSRKIVLVGIQGARKAGWQEIGILPVSLRCKNPLYVGNQKLRG
jgi:hypothetical protein